MELVWANDILGTLCDMLAIGRKQLRANRRSHNVEQRLTQHALSTVISIPVDHVAHKSLRHR